MNLQLPLQYNMAQKPKLTLHVMKRILNQKDFSL